MIIALSLSPSLDVTYQVDKLLHGDITRPRVVTRVPGGKALNMVRVAAALGAEVHAVVAVGGMTGGWIAKALTAEGVAATTVHLAHETRTCLAIVEQAASATSTDLYEPATTIDAGEWMAYKKAALTTVADAVATGDHGWVALSGAIPSGVEPSDVAVVLAAMRTRGARVAVDGSGAGLAATVASADLVKINRHEASELIAGDVSAMDACLWLRRRYGVDAIVTDGVAGAAAFIGSYRGEVPAPTRRGRFPAGSGDAFLGGLLAALDQGSDAERALASATDAAMRNALVPGQGRLIAQEP